MIKITNIPLKWWLTICVVFGLIFAREIAENINRGKEIDFLNNKRLVLNNISNDLKVLGDKFKKFFPVFVHPRIENSIWNDTSCLNINYAGPESNGDIIAIEIEGPFPFLGGFIFILKSDGAPFDKFFIAQVISRYSHEINFLVKTNVPTNKRKKEIAEINEILREKGLIIGENVNPDFLKD